MKRVLFLAPRCPYPADTGGKIRTLNILKAVARHCAVDLLCFSFSPDDEAARSVFAEWNIGLHLVPAGEDGVARKAGIMFTHTQPYSAVKYHTVTMRARMQALLAENAYDIVHIDHIHMAHYQDLAGGRTPVVVDEHNVECRILERCADAVPAAWKKWIFRGQAAKMKVFEAAQLRTASVVTAVSADDAAQLRALTNDAVRVEVLPNGVDTEFFSRGTWNVERENRKVKSEKGSGGADLVFTGSMDWLPNDDAMIYFCREVLPLVRRIKPDVRLDIVGKAPSRPLAELTGRDPMIRLTGRVDDVRDYVDPAAVFIVPLRIGGGTRLKILEAMSMQKAVVSTTIGAEGIAHTDGVNILLADTPQDFSAAVVRALDDPGLQESLGRAGRELVLSTYDWRIIGQTLTAMYEELC